LEGGQKVCPEIRKNVACTRSRAFDWRKPRQRDKQGTISPNSRERG